MRTEIEDALSLLRQGDDASLERALLLLQNTVLSFSMGVCGQLEDVEDISSAGATVSLVPRVAQ